MFATGILDKYWRDFDFQQELGGRKVFPRPKEKDPWHPIFVGLRFCIIPLICFPKYTFCPDEVSVCTSHDPGNRMPAGHPGVHRGKVSRKIQNCSQTRIKLLFLSVCISDQ